jgi:hypothetical protein
MDFALTANQEQVGDGFGYEGISRRALFANP